MLGGGVPDGAAAGTALATASAAPRDQQRAYAAGLAAYLHGYPPLLSRASQDTFLVNGLAGVAATTTPDNRLTVLPNVDTAYTVARLDLRNGPVVVHVPAMRGRYYTLQLMDAYTNVFGYIGTRVTGNFAGDYAISGPATRGRVARMRTIHSPTPDALLLGRTLVRPTDSVSELRAILGGFAMVPLSTVARGVKPVPSVVLDGAPPSRPPVLPSGIAFLDAFDRLLTADPPSAAERRSLAPFARFGIGPGRLASDTKMSAAVRRALLRGVASGPNTLLAQEQRRERISVREHAGWVMTGPQTALAGTDWAATCDCREGRAVGEHDERSDLCDRER